MTYSAALRVLTARNGSRSVGAVGLAAATALGACSDTDATDLRATPGSSDTGGSLTSPLYVVGTDVFSDTGDTGYLQTFSELSGQRVELADAVEIGGGGMRLEAISQIDSVVVRDRERLGIRRYAVRANGRLEETGFVSFQGLGVTNVNYLNLVGRKRGSAVHVDGVEGNDPLHARALEPMTIGVATGV